MPRNSTPHSCMHCNATPIDSAIETMQVDAIAELRVIASDDDLPDWLSASLTALVDRMEINSQLLLETSLSIDDDCLTFRNLVNTHIGKDRL